MLETALFFLAGFLTASILALLILPSINARAKRLARRRLAAQFPISIQELTAQMDHVRAESAIAVRAIERQLENERTAHAHTRIQLGKIEVQARQKAIADAEEISLLKQEQAMLKAGYKSVIKEHNTDKAIENIDAASSKKQELLDADEIIKVQQENAALRERIEAVAADVIRLTENKHNQKPAA